ncbi:unnamed protein product [Scytosiphon promiscuus]
MLKSELDKLAADHDNFEIVYVVDNPDDGWKGETGHINASLIEKHLPKPSSDSMIFVCGPPGMMKVSPVSGA